MSLGNSQLYCMKYK